MKKSRIVLVGLIVLAIIFILAFIKWFLAIVVFFGGVFLVVVGILAYEQSNNLPQWIRKYSPNVLLVSGIVSLLFGAIFLAGLSAAALSSDEENTSSQSRRVETSSEAIQIETADKFEADENGKVKIIGITEPGSSVELYRESMIITSGTADINGNFLLETNADPNTTTEYQVKVTKNGKTSDKRITVVGPTIPVVQLTVESTIKTTKDRTPLEGTTEPGAKVTLKRGDKVLDSKKADSNGEFKFTLPTSKSGSFTLTSEKKGLNANTATIEVERVLSAAEKKARYKKSCKTISYKRLKKNPDRYAGERYKARGKILQIMEGLGQTEMRIAVTKDSWGYWNYDDVIYVTYDGTTDFVEDDVVTVYGEVTGSYTYTSIAGWTITVPGVDAKYIEK